MTPDLRRFLPTLAASVSDAAFFLPAAALPEEWHREPRISKRLGQQAEQDADDRRGCFAALWRDPSTDSDQVDLSTLTGSAGMGAGGGAGRTIAVAVLLRGAGGRDARAIVSARRCP